MTNLISAPAISRIISSNTSIKKARSTGWSTGFYVVGLGSRVEVGYQDTDTVAVKNSLKYIADTINGRDDKKYAAEIEQTENGSPMVVVTLRSEDEIKEECMEQAAEESPFAVTKREVNKVLEGPCYPYSEGAAGYVIERAEAPNDRLVRVTYKDHPHTGYALVEGGREQYVKDSVKLYADKLRAAGFSVAVEGDYESVLVGQPGEFPSEDDPQEVKEALNALREAVEASDTAFLTRRAGDHSLFVVYQDLYKGETRRLEVFWRSGAYASYGRFGGPRSEFHNLDLTLKFIRSELGV
jgi:hypothetical protein